RGERGAEQQQAGGGEARADLPLLLARPDLRAEPVVDGVERVRVLGGGGRDELAAAVDWLPEAVLEARELGRATVSLHAPIGDGARELGDLLPAADDDAPQAVAERAGPRGGARVGGPRARGRRGAVRAFR